MVDLTGLGKLDRERLSQILRGTKGAISVDDAARILKISNSNAAKMLARWATKGWLARVRRGLYISVSLESRTADVALEDAWLIAEKLYHPCYIGGWSAAEHWGLTEQIFRTVIVMTTENLRERNLAIKGTKFLLRKISEENLFGLKPIWRGQVKVNISDPSRTIIDMLDNPQLGGGIRSVSDMFSTYLSGEHKDLKLLMQYAHQLGSGAVFKRLGFLLERFSPTSKEILEQCHQQLSQGNAKLDPDLPADNLITHWRLWVPKSWLKEKSRD